jgi:hypothetical protein
MQQVPVTAHLMLLQLRIKIHDITTSTFTLCICRARSSTEHEVMRGRAWRKREATGRSTEEQYLPTLEEDWLIFFTWWQRHASVGPSQLSPACLALCGEMEELGAAGKGRREGEEQGVAETRESRRGAESGGSWIREEQGEGTKLAGE